MDLAGCRHQPIFPADASLPLPFGMLAAAALLASAWALPAGNSTSASTAPSARAAVCSADRLPPGDHSVTLMVRAGNGELQERRIYVHVPEGMPEQQPQPALVSWHGCGSNVGPP